MDSGRPENRSFVVLFFFVRYIISGFVFRGRNWVSRCLEVSAMIQRIKGHSSMVQQGQI